MLSELAFHNSDRNSDNAWKLRILGPRSLISYFSLKSHDRVTSQIIIP